MAQLSEKPHYFAHLVFINKSWSPQEYNTTPSPSDSAVGDLENVLKEKDSEIVYLRYAVIGLGGTLAQLLCKTYFC